jgi:hypothetical protein
MLAWLATGAAAGVTAPLALFAFPFPDRRRATARAGRGAARRAVVLANGGDEARKVLEGGEYGIVQQRPARASRCCARRGRGRRPAPARRACASFCPVASLGLRT